MLPGKDQVAHSVGIRPIRPMLGEKDRGGARRDVTRPPPDGLVAVRHPEHESSAQWPMR